MKRSSLIAAVVIVLVANVFTLVHAWRNRSGPTSADIVLTQRELPLLKSAGEDNSSVELNLSWRSYDTPWNDSMDWMDAAKLAELGFDTHISASGAGAPEFYQRERPRRAFVALEYNGPASQRELALLNKQAEDHPETTASRPDPDKLSRLLPIDASLDPIKLRTAHPDSSKVILVPATIAISADQFGYLPEAHRPKPRLAGSILELPSNVHVPLPFGQELSARARRTGSVKYNVHLRYGASLEPWIVGIDFTPDDQANRH